MNAIAASFRKAMDALYFVCVLIAGTALVLISAVIPWGVYTRYVLNSAASWPEPAAVLLTIWLTFFGAAACYRLGIHMAVTVGVNLLPEQVQRACALLVEVLMAACRSVHGDLRNQAVPGDMEQHHRGLSRFCRLAWPIRRFRSAARSRCLFIVEHFADRPPAGAGSDPHLPVE